MGIRGVVLWSSICLIRFQVSSEVLSVSLNSLTFHDFPYSLTIPGFFDLSTPSRRPSPHTSSHDIGSSLTRANYPRVPSTARAKYSSIQAPAGTNSGRCVAATSPRADGDSRRVGRPVRRPGRGRGGAARTMHAGPRARPGTAARGPCTSATTRVNKSEPCPSTCKRATGSRPGRAEVYPLAVDHSPPPGIVSP